MIISAILTTSTITLATHPSSPNIQITLQKQEPDPVEPGRVVKLRFSVENLGLESVENLVVEIIPEFPFSLYPGEDDQKTIGKLNGLTTGEDAAFIEFKLLVSPEAVEGENEIKLRYKYHDSAWIELEPFIVNVKTRDAIIDVKTNSFPDPIPPGKKATVFFKLSNKADSSFENIKVAITLSDDVPFVPYGNILEKRIYRLEENQTKTISFELIALPDADAGAYKVPVTITFEDESGTKYEKNNYIGLIIGSVPDLMVLVEESDFKKLSSKGTITLKFVNKGLTKIKLLTAELLPNEGYEVISGTQYIGTIDSDDYDSAEFSIIPKKKQLSLKLKLSYYDANNGKYEKIIHVPAKLFIKKKTFLYVIFTTLVLCIGLAIYLLKFKKKKKR